MIQNLPDDILMEIAKFLNYMSVIHISQIGKSCIPLYKPLKIRYQSIIDKERTRRIRQYCITQNSMNLLYGIKK